jgi:chemotaxis protein CheX
MIQGYNTMLTSYDNVIEQIAQSVFATMLNIDLARVDEPPPPDHDLLLATVHIAGQWTGSVVLALSQEVARESAAAMLQVSSKVVTDADQQDVASELVNMIGGNLKSMLPGPSFLSLPTIISGREFGMEVHDAELLDDIVLACDLGLLRTRLYAKLPSLAETK